MSQFGLNAALHLDKRLPECLDGLVLSQTSNLSIPDRQSLSPDLVKDIELLVATFTKVHVFATGASCLSRLKDLLASLNDASDNNKSLALFIDVPFEQEKCLRRHSNEPQSDTSICPSDFVDSQSLNDFYGSHFFFHVAAQLDADSLPHWVVPIVVLRDLGVSISKPSPPSNSLSIPFNLGQHDAPATKYLDAGAVAVLASPLTPNQMRGAAAQVYRAIKTTARRDQKLLTHMSSRHLSWVGVNQDKPFAYLREAMVSTLMSGICHPEIMDRRFRARDVEILSERRHAVSVAVGKWAFSAHEFSDDELLYGAWVMLSHALKMPELEKWRISDDDLFVFLLASRAAYNEFVLYHNFRHVVDVMQALFTFLVAIQVLPPYGQSFETPASRQSGKKIHSLVSPFDAFTLLISAIGHDVGHPGVNNAFLVALNAPLAQLYNDRSVLESFHCAAFSQILRRYWPSAFADTSIRRLMINSVLATDMGLHFKYMSELESLQSKLRDNGNTVDGWNAKTLDEYRDLICGLLIKCADISNVAREFDTARKWALILTDEFSNQGSMEVELGMKTCLFGGPPERENLVKLGESQIGFINIFAQPLFEAVASIFPEVSFGVEEMLKNKTIWEKIIQSPPAKPTAIVASTYVQSSYSESLDHSSLHTCIDSRRSVGDQTGAKQDNSYPSSPAPSLSKAPDSMLESPSVNADYKTTEPDLPLDDKTKKVRDCTPSMTSRSPTEGGRSMKAYRSLDRIRHPFSSKSQNTSIVSPPNTASHGLADRSAGSFTDSTRPTSREWSTTDEPAEMSLSVVTAHSITSPTGAGSLGGSTEPVSSLGPENVGPPTMVEGTRQLSQTSGDAVVHHSHDSFFSKRPSRFSLAYWRQWRRDLKSGSGSGSGSGSRASSRPLGNESLPQSGRR